MLDDDSSHPELQPISPEETAGQILSSARLGWDLTVEEVADNLNLSADTIRALEKDEYESLPGYTFVKGYIRSYANLLRLNPDELVSLLDVQPEKLSEIPSTKSSIRQRGKTTKRAKSRAGKVFKWVFVFLLLIVLALVGLNQWSKLDTEGIAELFKLPSGSSEEAAPNDDIVFPGVDENTDDDQEEEQKGALIRIE